MGRIFRPLCVSSILCLCAFVRDIAFYLRSSVSSCFICVQRIGCVLFRRFRKFSMANNWYRMAIAAMMVLGTAGARAQDRLPTMPGYARYQQASAQRNALAEAANSGALDVTWTDGGRAFGFSRDGKNYRYDIAARRVISVAEPVRAEEDAPVGRRRRGQGGQGRFPGARAAVRARGVAGQPPSGRVSGL